MVIQYWYAVSVLLDKIGSSENSWKNVVFAIHYAINISGVQTDMYQK